MGLNTTTITGKVYLPNGQIATAGEILVALNQSGSSDDAITGASERVGGRKLFAIQATGDVEAGMALVPNDAILPVGTFYRVTFTITAPTPANWIEGWSITAAPDPVEIGDITRVSVT